MVDYLGGTIGAPIPGWALSPKKVLLCVVVSQMGVDPSVRSMLRFFRGCERAPEGSALAATTARSTLVCDKQAKEEARLNAALCSLYELIL